MHKTYVRKSKHDDLHSYLGYCTECVWRTYTSTKKQALDSAAIHRKTTAGGAAAASVHKLTVYAPGTHWAYPERAGKDNWVGRCGCGSWVSGRQPNEDAVREKFSAHFEKVV